MTVCERTIPVKQNTANFYGFVALAFFFLSTKNTSLLYVLGSVGYVHVQLNESPVI
jgi:hypothetical protein